jgi:endonuclease/exonuclease/phosphatase family metal-dependent hydrolase
MRAAGEALGQGYVFGVEFVELGLGDAEERRRLAGIENARGLHGAGILSRYALRRPALVRIEADGNWFDDRRGERRIGGRMAVLAALRAGDRDVVFATVHIESHSSPRQRADQTAELLARLEDYAPGAPAVIGGDFNTSTVTHEAEAAADFAALLHEAPLRLLDPVAYEPLFEAAARHGFDWRRANARGATTRNTGRLDRQEPPYKLDWFFTRGVEARNATIVPAVTPDGDAVSDHELLLLEIGGVTQDR